MKKVLIVLGTIFVILSATILFAEAISFTASLDQDTVPINETVNYSLTLTGTSAGGARPSLPQMKGFSIVGTSSSSSFSFINGVKSSSTSFEYTLQANKQGKFRIQPSTINIDGKVYKTQALNITVTAPSPNSQRRASPHSQWRSSPFGSIFGQSPFEAFEQRSTPRKTGVNRAFVKSDTNKKIFYVNEQIIYSFKFYRRIQLLQNPSYSQADMTGFVVIDLPDPQKNYRESVNGLDYNVSEIKTALFPTSPGEFKIGQSTLTLPGGFFSRGSVLKTKQIKLKILPLPEEGKPENFSGVVGSFRIKASLNKNKAKAGEAITLTVTVSGNGNIDNIEKPVIEEKSGITIYSSKENKVLEKGKGRVEGSKSFESIIVSEKDGEISLGKVYFNFFNPVEKKYVTVSSQEIKFTITPSTEATVEARSENIVIGKQKVPSILNHDIVYIKQDAEKLENQDYVYKSAAFWLVQLLALLAVIGSALVSFHNEKMNTDIGYARLQKAKKISKSSMKGAQKALEDESQEEFFRNLHKALVEYIGNKLNLPSAGLTKEKIREELSARGIHEETIGKLIVCLERCDMARFSSSEHSQDEMQESLFFANEVILEMEKRLDQTFFRP